MVEERMKFVRVLATGLAFALSACGTAGESVVDAFSGAKVLSVQTKSLDDMTVTVKEIETPESLKASVKAQVDARAAAETVRHAQALNDDLGAIDVALDQIINIGKKVWSVVSAGKPVMNVKFDFATAFPKGITVASELHGFSDLQYKSFDYVGTNGFGMEVFRVQYTVVYQYGGSYEGKGAYIASATIVPQNVSAVWGYSLGMNVDNVSVANLGSTKSPVAGMNLMANIKVSTVLKAQELNELFAIRGDNGLLTRAH
jgi:hypothetical protein